VSFVDLTDAEATAVLEQQFEFDLVSPQKLLERYLDEEVTLMVPLGDGQRETVTGTLVSMMQNQLVLQTEEGLRIIPYSPVNNVQVALREAPGGLVTRPTLSWLVRSAEAGERQVRTSYQTDGITWRADYNLVLGADETTADLSAWVTLLNLSGTGYENAQLKLIAGDVQRIQPPQTYAAYQQLGQMSGARARQEAFEQEPFFEYHLYTLPRRTDVPQNSTKQLTLFPTATDVSVERVLVYYGLPEQMRWAFTPRANVDRDIGQQSNPQVDVYIEFENREENNVGMPLPRGKVRVFKENPDDAALEFIGEDLISHTPRNERVLVKVGQAFDVVGERVQTDFRREGNVMEESFRIRIRNQKDEAERVIIRESMFRWVQWEITEASEEFEKIDSRTVHFEVEVPAEGEQEVTYTVRYLLW
jgi:hypothetical protein